MQHKHRPRALADDEIALPCVDTPVRASGFLTARSCDRMRSCVRPSGAACNGRWPVWRCADLAQINVSSCWLVGRDCFSKPGSDRSFDLTVLRPPHTPDGPSALGPDL